MGRRLRGPDPWAGRVLEAQSVGAVRTALPRRAVLAARFLPRWCRWFLSPLSPCAGSKDASGHCYADVFTAKGPAPCWPHPFGSNSWISGSADCEPLQFPCVHEGQHIANHCSFVCVPKSPKMCSRPKHTGNTLPPEAMGRRARPAPRLGEQRTCAAAARAPQDMKAVRAAIAHFKPPPALASAGPAHLTTSCSAATRRRDVARKNAAAEASR